MNLWTWEQYNNWLKQNYADSYQYLFRGQEDSSWILETSFHRISEPSNLNLEVYIQNIIPEVHNQMVSKGFEAYNLNDIQSFNSFLAKLQHHSFPTPLLDWTYSPYIAAYFGIKSTQKHISPYFSIYVFDYIRWIRNNYQPTNLLIKEPFVSTFKPYYFNNPRLITQNSILTITNQKNIEEYLLNMGKKQETVYLYKINIPKSEISKIKEDLDNRGINENILFPSLDGICSNMKRNFFSY
ncbi:FRG domain-containing protein [Aliarcobacter butzleri]|uniref:FRG domain-containing protein n=1 Tax=Aliarcobacter butzleri TaxID=28197 RepID=UPI0021B547C1|nr:FRG domain-containing protein [Aliarcobacter butzleri]MCT7575290.1 FRG domain-containing protein [Aliarcobacter butzleri]